MNLRSTHSTAMRRESAISPGPIQLFFSHLEHRIADLRALGIEADLILFHPYDRWGYATMPAEADDRYLRSTSAIKLRMDRISASG
jgi:hypothetical protein